MKLPAWWPDVLIVGVLVVVLAVVVLGWLHVAGAW